MLPSVLHLSAQHPAVQHAIAVLADDGGGESKKAGPIALLVILLLAVACYFLFRSMTKHLRRVRDHFPDDTGATPPGEMPPDDLPPGDLPPDDLPPGRSGTVPPPEGSTSAGQPS